MLENKMPYYGSSTVAGLLNRLAEQGGDLARKMLQFVAQPDPGKAREDLVSELGFTIGEYADIAARAQVIHEAEVEAREELR